MNLESSCDGWPLSRLDDALGPGRPFGGFVLWSVPRPRARLSSIKVWAKAEPGRRACRIWVFYPGAGNDRDAEEFRVQSRAELGEVLRRIGAAAQRGRAASR